ITASSPHGPYKQRRNFRMALRASHVQSRIPTGIHAKRVSTASEQQLHRRLVSLPGSCM
ncbi:hypothetical protein ASPCADRAFT_204792, partial [Aspergillus carbonarius ITEM 5010]